MFDNFAPCVYVVSLFCLFPCGLAAFIFLSSSFFVIALHIFCSFLFLFSIALCLCCHFQYISEHSASLFLSFVLLLCLFFRFLLIFLSCLFCLCDVSAFGFFVLFPYFIETFFWSFVFFCVILHVSLFCLLCLMLCFLSVVTLGLSLVFLSFFVLEVVLQLLFFSSTLLNMNLFLFSMGLCPLVAKQLHCSQRRKNKLFFVSMRPWRRPTGKPGSCQGCKTPHDSSLYFIIWGLYEK